MIARVALVAALLAASGCAVVQEKTLGESFDEASASNQIKTRLMAASAARFSEVDVEVSQRFVLLSGRVATTEDRLEAEKIAWSVSTIDEVANELVVADRSIARDVSDEWISAQVRARLAGDPVVKGVNFNIETYAGNVYLLGIAQSQEELEAAAEHASTVKGVVRVVSYVKVRGRPSTATEPAARRAPAQPAATPQRQPATPGSGYTDPYAQGAPTAPSPRASAYPELDGAPGN